MTILISTLIKAIIIVVMVIMVSIVSNKHGYNMQSLLSVHIDGIVRVVMIVLMIKSNHS